MTLFFWYLLCVYIAITLRQMVRCLTGEARLFRVRPNGTIRSMGWQLALWSLWWVFLPSLAIRRAVTIYYMRQRMLSKKRPQLIKSK